MSRPIVNMAVFPFNKLPPELRQYISDIALLVEAKNRMVIVHTSTQTIYPTKLLISPFLLVNSESRGRAKRFYSYREPVAKIKRKDFMSQSELGRQVGAVYLSAEHDTLCPGFDWSSRRHKPRKERPCTATCYLKKGGSFYRTAPFGKHSLLFQSVRKACSMVFYLADPRDRVRNRYCGEPAITCKAIKRLGIFPNTQHWFAIFYPRPDSDIRATVHQGWKGQRRLMRRFGSQYAVARLADDSNKPTAHFMLVSDFMKLIDA